jgi:hypothetical protein
MKLKQSQEAHLQNIRDEMSTVLLNLSLERWGEINEISELARQLALEFGIQRSRLHLFAPQLGGEVVRNTKVYEDLNNKTPHSVAKGVVQLIAAPGLARTGDGRGYNFHDDAVELWPAAVYMTPSPS